MSAWIFQGNPKLFDVDRYLMQHRHKNEIVWTVRPKRRIERGDRAFIWRADGGVKFSGGLVAVGRVLSAPEFITDDAPELWRAGEQDATQPEWQVRIHLDEIRLTERKGMLRRVDLEKDPVLSGLQILHYRAVMVSPVSTREEDALLTRWAERRPSASVG